MAFHLTVDVEVGRLVVFRSDEPTVHIPVGKGMTGDEDAMRDQAFNPLDEH